MGFGADLEEFATGAVDVRSGEFADGGRGGVVLVVLVVVTVIRVVVVVRLQELTRLDVYARETREGSVKKQHRGGGRRRNLQ